MPHISLLKFSALLVLSQFVFQSEQLQPCLGIAKAKNSGDYSFALAQVDDYHNPLGPQEACYYSCGAQVVTQSSNRGDMNRLTLMDNAAPHLMASGFLKVGESYFLNHLGLEDEEGGNGIGCIEVRPGNKIVHHPKSHPVCSMAKIAVCGFWGQQSIPPQPKENKPKAPSRTIATNKPKPTRRPRPTKRSTTQTPISTPSKSTFIPPTDSPSTLDPTDFITDHLVVPSSSETVTVTPINTSSKSTFIPPTDLPSTLDPTDFITDHLVPPSTQVVVSEIVTVTEVALPTPVESSMLSIDFTSPNQPEESNNSAVEFKVNGERFHVINKFEKSLASADNVCSQKQLSIASVTSESFPIVSNILKEMAQGKVIIGAWNGDNYSLTGDHCLILQTNHGIFPGTCTDASAILCQASS